MVKLYRRTVQTADRWYSSGAGRNSTRCYKTRKLALTSGDTLSCSSEVGFVRYKAVQRKEARTDIWRHLVLQLARPLVENGRRRHNQSARSYCRSVTRWFCGFTFAGTGWVSCLFSSAVLVHEFHFGVGAEQLHHLRLLLLHIRRRVLLPSRVSAVRFLEKDLLLCY